MDLLLDICQGIGLACAVGIRPFLPALLAGALATANLGVDFDHTKYSFLEQPWFLLLLVIGSFLLVVAERRLGPERLEFGLASYVLAAVAAVLGVLLFAGTLADRGEATWPAIFGVACAIVAFTAIRALLVRTRSRLDADAGRALPAYAEGLALLAAGVSVALPPLGLVVLAFLLALLVTGRRREGQKYAGLRILR
jgi:low temperature requirement protein LtrA